MLNDRNDFIQEAKKALASLDERIRTQIQRSPIEVRRKLYFLRVNRAFSRLGDAMLKTSWALEEFSENIRRTGQSLADYHDELHRARIAFYE